MYFLIVELVFKEGSKLLSICLNFEFDTTRNSESIILVPTIRLHAADRHDTARAQNLFLLDDDGGDDE